MTDIAPALGPDCIFTPRLKAVCIILRFQISLYLPVISRFRPCAVSGYRSLSLPHRFAARERLAGIGFLLGGGTYTSVNQWYYQEE